MARNRTAPYNLPDVLTDDTLVVATPEQVSTELGDSVVILHTESGVYYTLDGVGALVWRQLLDDKATLAGLQQQVLERYDVNPAQCRSDLVALLGDLARADLVTLNEP